MRSLIIFIVLVISVVSCQMQLGSIEGNGVIETREKPVGRFSKLEISGAFKVKIIPAEEHKILIETDENIHEYIRVEEDDNRVRIKLRNNVSIKPTKGVKITIYMQDVNKIELAGSVDLKSEGLLEHPEKIDLAMAGSADADIAVKTPEMKISIGGSGKVIAEGETRELKVSIAGSGDLKAENLLSEEVDISIAGSGSARVYASIGLKVSVAGSGNVYYAGNPGNVKKSIAGSGNVKPISENQ